MIIDITERNQIEERMREQLFKVFNHSPSMIGITKVEDGKYIDVNASWCRCLGYQRKEAIGRTALELDLWANPDERDQVVNALLQGKEVNDFEMNCRTRSGEIRQGTFSPRIFELHGESHRYAQVEPPSR